MFAIASSYNSVSNCIGRRPYLRPRTHLQDALDTRHSKTKAVEFTIKRADALAIDWPMVTSGIFMVCVGFLIYYLFPLSLLTFNLFLLFYMFFGLLLCMLLGLILLALNLENFLEWITTFVFFWWENAAIRALTVKNLVAHRKRNRKTTIMYALSLAFVIWISVSFNLQISSFQYRVMQSYGTRMSVLHGSELISYRYGIVLNHVM